MVERGLLQVAAGLTDRPKEPSEADAATLGADQIAAGQPAGAKVVRGLSLLSAAALAWALIRRR